LGIHQIGRRIDYQSASRIVRKHSKLDQFKIGKI